MQVVVDGLMTNYLKTGSAKNVIVCLHGWGDSSQTFTEIAKRLSGEYTVLALDLPGFGGSQEPRRAWGVDEYARFVVNWLNKIGAKKVYGVIGHSNGGAIAIAMLASRAVDAKKLVLVSSSGIRDVNKLRKSLLGGGAKIAKLPLMVLPKSTQYKLKRRAYAAVGSDYGLIPEMDASYRKIISQDMQSAATKIGCPTLLIYGTDDNTTPLKYGQLFREAIGGSKLITIESVGHFPHQEKPAEVSKALGDFLNA